MNKTNAEEIFSLLPENLQKVVCLLSVTPILTDNIANNILFNDAINYTVLDTVKQLPIWHQRNLETWSIDNDIRIVALKKLNGSFNKYSVRTLTVLKDIEQEIKNTFSIFEAHDWELQIGRLSLKSPDSFHVGVMLLRHHFNAADLYENIETTRVISEYIDESIDINSTKEQWTSELLNAYFMRGIYAYRKKNKALALRLLLPVWEKFNETLGSIHDAAISAHIIGIVWSKDHNLYDKAERAFKDSIKLRVNDTYGLAQVHHSLGNLYSTNPKCFEKAEEEYLKSIELRERDTLGLAQVHNSLGNLYAKKEKHFEDAEKHFMESIKLGGTNPIHLAQVHHSLGNLYSKKTERFDDAEKEYLESIRLDERNNNPFGLAKIYHSLGNLYSTKIEYFNSAVKAYLKGIRLDERNNNPFGLALIHFSLGNLYSTNENYIKNAECEYIRCINYGTKSHFHLASVYLNYGELKKRQKDFKKAIELFNKSLENEKNKQTIQNLKNLITECQKNLDSFI